MLYAGDHVVEFPYELSNYGLTESLLEEVWSQVECAATSLKWCLEGVPNVCFYQDLFCFLKSWHKSNQATKVSIGRFCIAIDKNLQDKGCHPDNAYKFIERVVKLPRNTQINYGLQKQEIKNLTQLVEKLTLNQKKIEKKTKK